MYRVNVNVNNMPDFNDGFAEPGKYYVVARVDERTRELWYYGTYSVEEKAYEVAKEIRNGVVLIMEIIPDRPSKRGIANGI